MGSTDSREPNPFTGVSSFLGIPPLTCAHTRLRALSIFRWIYKKGRTINEFISSLLIYYLDEMTDRVRTRVGEGEK